MQIATDKLNFTVGPVMMDEDISKLGGEQVPYFRTRDFSELVCENERILKKLLFADGQSRVICLTGSGTAGMEAAVMNMLTGKDRALIVNGGSFGARFVQICRIHGIPCDEISLQTGRGITQADLEPYENQGYTAFLVNRNETSTGVLYDMGVISDFCKRNHCFLIVDAISSFLADELYMKKWGINAVITGSQKAYAIPPGLSLIALDERAVERVQKNDAVCSLYFDLKLYLKDGARGQTPFTPAVGTMIQLNHRLCTLEKLGVENEIKRIAALAEYFRKQIVGLPLEIASESLSNAVTPLYVREGKKAHEVFEYLEQYYGIWVCPNGGELKDKLFRVGHLGNLTTNDYDKLVAAMTQLYKKQIL